MKISVKKVHPGAKVPQFAHDTDAGCDVFSAEEVTLAPGERKIVSTGIAMAIPQGYVGLVWDKSSVSGTHGVKTMGGVLDSGYRGEIKIILLNTSSDTVQLESGRKIAQMLIQPIHQATFEEVENLDDTDRGEGGFGSTGTV